MNDQAPPVETTITGNEPVAPPAAAPEAKPAPGADLSAMRDQLDSLKAQMAEQQRTTEYWYNQAKGNGEKPAPAAKEPEDDVDLLEVVTTKGAKGLDDVIAKRGYMRKADVEGMIEARATQMTKEAELIGRFPDLKNQQSEFFKETAQHYGNLKAQGVPQHLAMEMAAERVALSHIESGKLKTRQQTADTDKATRETTRRARAAAQEGDRGSRAPAGNDDDDELTPEQKHIAKAMGISEEAYQKRAKQGVALKGVR
jgi:hypothetical protein